MPDDSKTDLMQASKVAIVIGDSRTLSLSIVPFDHFLIYNRSRVLGIEAVVY